ncbi:MAG TPA: hypothetical protein VMF32_26805 [Xanthobacteraceae bacterium]|nr:hypothetical protein [Xanthobacteraceae bacterium]
MPNDVPHTMPSRRSGVGWGIAVLAAVIVVIMIGWGWSGHGRGWGRRNQIAHMMPPVSAGMNGPATRAWTPPNGR